MSDHNAICPDTASFQKTRREPTGLAGMSAILFIKTSTWLQGDTVVSIKIQHLYLFGTRDLTVT